ncbi:hypothetical protein Tsubulata_043359 [Turnera subulata]|uniref:Uncharacterized protein n=1 Tax=Turnera subulata TaxID=218843 RepID=A0A9Q0JJG9_9ROSI|nr:hypothetical protein Tsubulata_043359 [Turnera subulata]
MIFLLIGATLSFPGILLLSNSFTSLECRLHEKIRFIKQYGRRAIINCIAMKKVL